MGWKFRTAASLLVAGALGACGDSRGVEPSTPLHLAFVNGPGASVVATQGLGAVTVIFADDDGNIVAGAPRPVTLSLVTTDTAAHIVGTTTVLSAAGVVSFAGLKIPRAGSGYQLLARSANADSALTPAFSVVPGPVGALAVTGVANVVAGEAMSTVTVSVTDSVGNVITNASPTVSLTVASGGGALIGTTSVSAVAGVATFTNLSLQVAGTHTLRAESDGIAGTSDAFFVSSGALSQWRFSAQPVNVAPGATLPTVTVSCTDAYGNPASVSGPYLNTSVTLSLGANPGSAVLGGTLTKSGAGVVQFSDLTVSAAGSGYTLVVTPNLGYCATMPGATSSAFNVAP